MSLVKHIALYLICSFSLLQTTLAGDPDYSVSAIPAALKENAHAVKRMEVKRLEITGAGEFIVNHHYAITILDASAAKHATLAEGYDKFTDLRSVKGALYDAQGKQIRKLKQSEIQDLSAVDDASLMTDSRVKVHSFYHAVYPYTIEYEVEQKVHQTFILEHWVPQEDEEYSVENSRLIVNTPTDFNLRYHHFNYKAEPEISNEKGTRTYIWEVKNMAALPDESYAPEWYRRTASVFLAPSSFEIQRYKGTMNTWEELSRFIYALNKDRDQLPETVKQTVHQLTDGHTREEKISILYRYLQQHTRYISVQLGIGGMQTFDANYVASKGYGDCKALSNYMCALLKEAGIAASCVLVHAGDGYTTLREDFPSDQFNHMIACVPGPKDTTWLECTSSNLPAGYLSGFTANRPVLVMSEAGSKLTRTPAYDLEKNIQSSQIKATVSENGDMLLNVNTHRTGLQQDDLWGKLHALSRDKVMESLKKGYLFSSYDVNRYEWNATQNMLPAIDEKIEIAAHNYASVSGKRMFIVPNLMNRSISRPESRGARLSDISLRYPFRDIDTVLITVPAGYKPESVPPPVVIKSAFGSYSAEVAVNGDVITYIRKIDHKAGSYPASAFTELESFYNAIYKADRGRVVLVKN